MSLTRVNYGNTLKVDGTNNHVGFGTATPQAPIDASLTAQSTQQYEPKSGLKVSSRPSVLAA